MKFRKEIKYKKTKLWILKHHLDPHNTWCDMMWCDVSHSAAKCTRNNTKFKNKLQVTNKWNYM